MIKSSLETFVKAMSADWRPLDSRLISDASRHMQNLLKASSNEKWLSALHKDFPASKELFRDLSHGYVLLAHTEPEGQYRPPHDHGSSWVIYAVQHGSIEMGTYARVKGADGKPYLVKRNTTIVSAGQIQVYLPGDIHDTRCAVGPALLFRFTERDLRKEDEEGQKIIRYVEQNGAWTEASA